MKINFMFCDYLEITTSKIKGDIWNGLDYNVTSGQVKLPLIITDRKNRKYNQKLCIFKIRRI